MTWYLRLVKRRLFAFALLLLGWGCGAGPVGAGPDGGGDLAAGDAVAIVDLPRPLDGGLGTALGSVQLTYYWVADERAYSGANDTLLCDVNATPIATVPLAFANALALEGSGRLTDGRLLNVGGNCACASGMTTCYVVLDTTRYPWGVGAMSRALVPFRSIAVDPTFIPIGHKVYVPELDGVQMPSSYGFLHDGCLRADDVGGGISGAHIDFFAAERSNYLTLDGQLKLSAVRAYVDPPRCP